MLQRSFSIVDDDDDEEALATDDDDDHILANYEMQQVHGTVESAPAHESPGKIPLVKVSSPGPSGRKTVLKSRPPTTKTLPISSESDDDSDEDKSKTPAPIPGEYDPKQYENLDVNEEIKEIFQYITKYIPQSISLDHKFKPFVPEFLPAVGDIDAFLKVVPPDEMVSGEVFEGNSQLGLTVLDEPAANQSDSALLHLQLRAKSVNVSHRDDVVVKKVDNVEKNVKTIDKWIKDISDLHKSKSSPTVRYSEAMPDLDDLMQEWPEDMEKRLREEGFPEPETDVGLGEYIDVVCSTFQIPVKNRMHSLHLLFCLYAAVKGSQLFKESNAANKNSEIEAVVAEDTADQLVLE